MTSQKNKTNGGDAKPIKIPRDLWARIVKAIRIGTLLPAIVRHSPNFDFTPFVTGCNQLLDDALRLTKEAAELEQATDRQVPDAE